MNRRMLLTVLAGAAVVFCGSANAEVLEEGTYLLKNHPDVNEATPFYGLRLDELRNVTDGNDIFTFDFEADGSEMLMELQGDSIHIFGVAFGGLDIGGSYDPNNSGFFEIDFTYGNVGTVPGDDDFWVTKATNGGSISEIGTDETWELTNVIGDEDFAFRLGNEDDDNGHRGFDGVSGWGWLAHDGGENTGTSDWIFTVGDPIPAPAGAFVFLGALAARRRRGR